MLFYNINESLMFIFSVSIRPISLRIMLLMIGLRRSQRVLYLFSLQQLCCWLGGIET